MSRVRSAAKRFINTLATDWRALGSFYEDDLVNSILADVALSVEETLVLVELVNEQPQASLADIVSVARKRNQRYAQKSGECVSWGCR